ncbi:hypothetical protein AVEN_187137-1 [Araneus ventricosus]|uniref:Uncharacterized protein n=1 Tax=Araneus ventricosus TaxID=182803 RepID=A0A4Y2SL48_ARAVE|nr:hypothetical protein AVEN_187137-1 [Araneus ventricosus]
MPVSFFIVPNKSRPPDMLGGGFPLKSSTGLPVLWSTTYVFLGHDDVSDDSSLVILNSLLDLRRRMQQLNPVRNIRRHRSILASIPSLKSSSSHIFLRVDQSRRHTKSLYWSLISVVRTHKTITLTLMVEKSTVSLTVSKPDLSFSDVQLSPPQ